MIRKVSCVRQRGEDTAPYPLGADVGGGRTLCREPEVNDFRLLASAAVAH